MGTPYHHSWARVEDGITAESLNKFREGELKILGVHANLALTINGNDGRPIVTIGLSDGSVTITEGAQINDTAREFWKAVLQAYAPTTIPAEIRARALGLPDLGDLYYALKSYRKSGTDSPLNEDHAEAIVKCVEIVAGKQMSKG